MRGEGEEEGEETAAAAAGAAAGTGDEESADEKLVLVDDDALIDLWLPGRIVHIYAYRGVYMASEVPRTFDSLRKIVVQGNIFTDHSSSAIYNALLEVRAVRERRTQPSKWTPFDASDHCQVPQRERECVCDRDSYSYR
jgi:hypothetical protein